MRLQPIILGLLVATTPITAYTPKSHLNYTVIPGIFQQDDPATNASTFNFTASNFGLIDRAYPSDSTCPNRKQSTQWQRLAHYISTLNSKAKKTDRYVLFFLGRHGEGYHNAAESYFGTPAWNCYWSERDGNGTVTWADAHITPKGIDQALSVNAFWKHLIKDEKITPPQTYYTSPLFRCLSTAKLTFQGLDLPMKYPFVPTVKEHFREGISAHTCDRRSTKSAIRTNFPSYRIERGFAEKDPYWMELYAEPRENQDARSKEVLDDVLGSDTSTYISVTSHSGEIASLLRVLGHRVFSLATGAAIPVLVKTTTLKGDVPATPTLPYTPQKTCAAPPTIRDSSCNDCSCCT
ncbi:phosphoglycerate mutase-like protein [Lentithecium fluviatile CBS 122367]|uniref:Phosphoglycerate mutase-like protein n=1 Tax=Lentithecium fluviatile CBS 122367 TaxID=1168545 RepID=A0A6G1JNH8_9PLEO|nr:phosphoglycerate mutase-like protein [Lentithecium fluviatile CBS 122367]